MDDAKPFGAYAPHGFVRWAVDTTRGLPNTWLARRLVILLRRVVQNRLGGAPVDVEALGARMRLHPYNNVCEKRMLFTPDTFDPDELRILDERLDRASGATSGRDFVFIDVGANVGAYSLYVAGRAGSAARILAVEPQTHIYERLIGNIRLNEFRTIKAIDCAVADKPGDVTLFLDARNSGESSVKIVGSGAATGLRVPAKTLCGLVREEGFDHVDAVKLDVEGAEDIILEPFFGQAPPEFWPELIIIEDGRPQWQIDLPRLLESHGYRLLKRTRLNLVFERAQDGGGLRGERDV